VRDAEGGGERSEPPALPRGAKRRGDCSPSVFYIKVLTNVL